MTSGERGRVPVELVCFQKVSLMSLSIYLALLEKDLYLLKLSNVTLFSV